MVLAQLEELTERPLSELFDVVAGTSIGGILALGLVCPGLTGRPKYSAKALEEQFRVDGPGIFHNPASWLENVMHAKYKSTSLQKLLRHLFGNTRLKDALTNVLIPCYDLEHRSPHFFRSRWARRRERYDFLMRDVAQATSAAPTVFNPVHIKLPGNLESVSLVDGGVFANNPAMAAYIDTKTVLADRDDDFLIVSLGTGESPRKLVHDDVKRWGYAQWSRPIIELVCDGISASVHSQMRYLLPPEGHQRYYRFQVDLPEESDDSLDNVSKANMRGLMNAATYLVQNRTSRAELQRLAARLIELADQDSAIITPGAEPATLAAPASGGAAGARTGTGVEAPIEVTSPKASSQQVSICYADEDVETVVSLAEALKARGINAVYDKYGLQSEDSIRRMIMEVETLGPFSIVLVSPGLVANLWADKQLGWLFARLVGGHQLLLAVTHGFDAKQPSKLTHDMGWQHAAVSYLERIIELSLGSTDNGVEKIADAIASEITHWSGY